MSSTAEESGTNALTSSRNTSFSLSTRWGDESPSSRLTAEMIVKECVRNGYYRNPICNEVLYLHHKGITEIDPDAFDRYTETKVLWLEGNGLTHLACGEGFVQVKPPKAKKLFEEETEEEEEDEEKEEDKNIVVENEVKKADGHSHVSDDDERREACRRGKVERHVDPHAVLPFPSSSDATPMISCSGCEGKKYEQQSLQGLTDAPCQTVSCTGKHAVSALPESGTIPLEKKDIFSSLYKKVRQLYLHNNVLRTMPDLSRFQRLDTVNISHNFFPAIRCGCPQWRRGMKSYQEEEEKQKQISGTVKGKTQEEENGRAAGTFDGGCSEMEVVRSHEGDRHAEVEPMPLCKATEGEEERKEGEETNNEKEESASHDSGCRTVPHCNCETPPSSLSSETNAACTSGATEAPYVNRLPLCAVEMASSMMLTRVVPAKEAAMERQEQLQTWTALADRFLLFCSHEPLEEEMLSKKWNEICFAQRCPCSSLRTLNAAGNHLEFFEDLCGLLCYKNLSVLDISQNQIKDGEMLLLILERLPRLRSLKLSGNPLVRSLRRYRKTVVSRCRQLLYLDDRPVFEEERRMVNAWAAGGDEGEEAERKAIKNEEEAKKKKQMDDFRRLIQKSKKLVEERERNEGKEAGESKVCHPHTQYINAITTSEALDAVAVEEDEETSSGTSSDDDSELSHSRSANGKEECPEGELQVTDPPQNPQVMDALKKEATNHTLSSSPVTLPTKDSCSFSQESAALTTRMDQAFEDDNASSNYDDAVYIPS